MRHRNKNRRFLPHASSTSPFALFLFSKRKGFFACFFHEKSKAHPLSKIAVRGEGGDGAVGDGGGYLADGFGAAVARDEYAFRGGEAFFVGDDVAVFVALGEVFGDGRVGREPDGDENAVEMKLFFISVGFSLRNDAAELGFAEELFDYRAENDFDVGFGKKGVL